MGAFRVSRSIAAVVCLRTAAILWARSMVKQERSTWVEEVITKALPESTTMIGIIKQAVNGDMQQVDHIIR